MIQYNSGSYGFSILLRIHGSAVYKSLLPSLLSCAIYISLYHTIDLASERELFLHPYPMGALIAALTFLLSFRANFSYNRYWEGITAVHHMHSKWLDVGMQLAAFHLQASIYNARKPPSFGAHPEYNHLEVSRQRLKGLTLKELGNRLEALEDDDDIEEVMGSTANSKWPPFFRRRKKKVDAVPNCTTHCCTTKKKSSNISKKEPHHARPLVGKSINASSVHCDSPCTSSHSAVQQFSDWFHNKSVKEDPKKAGVVRAIVGNPFKAWDMDKPPLFLQESAHLLSLLSAVAFSTLRNDLEQADSPLITFTQNAPWPCVDPDSRKADIRKDWETSNDVLLTARYILGNSRSPADRTLYNAARPFRVIGGISDTEIELLQAARGPLAKVALCSMWLQEFISREYLAGALGEMAPPIVSRLYQSVSDGMLGYNQARKVAYIPFPFPHAQITSLFVLVVVGFMPVLMLSYLTNEFFGFVLNLLVVMSFSGLHEVSRELEDPFKNVPNDVPLNNFQAQYNESLMQMFAGYHPDAFWEVVDTKEQDSAHASTPELTTEVSSSINGTIEEESDQAEASAVQQEALSKNVSFVNSSDLETGMTQSL